jgi:hypothetical protein
MIARVKALSWFTATWVMSVITLCVFWYDFNGFSGAMLRVMLKGLCLIAGMLLAAFWLIAIRKERIWLSPIIAISLIGFLVCAYLTTAERVGRYSKFYLYKRNYETSVGEIIQFRQSKSTSDACNHSFDYCIDPGPPVRVAYVWGGHLDNWYGVVYDPTGEVLESTKSGISWSSRNDPSSKNFKMLFSSHLISAKHLTGSWYFCDFDEQ